MKKYKILVLAVLFSLCAAGCGTDSKALPDSDAISMPETNPETGVETSALHSDSARMDEAKKLPMVDSFTLTYEDQETDIEISLEKCSLEYDKDGTLIYSMYINRGICINKIGLVSSYSQYVLYIQTPLFQTQIFPVKDFVINQDTDSLYIIRKVSDFEALQKVSLKEAQTSLNYEELFDRDSLENMIGNAHQFSNIENRFSDLNLEFTGNKENNPILKGVASGIYKTTGKKYYIDLKWNEDTKKAAAEPCILKVYDTQKDTEAFEKCRKAFDLIEQGDWSMVTPQEDKGYMWGMGGEDWRRADVNGDGLPELICQDGSGDREEHKKPIDLIFTWHNDKVDLVYMDLIDAMEFLFLSDAGQLFYESSELGCPRISSFIKCHFDEKWNRTFEEALDITWFPDESVFDDGSALLQRLRESYPDTFGTYGGGAYYMWRRLKTEAELKDDPDSSYRIEEPLTQKQFMDAYRNLTGQDFLKDNAFYWEEIFQEIITAEKFYDYEIRTDENQNKYAVLKGIREEYKGDFVKIIQKLTNNSRTLYFPEALEGIEVKEIAASAFRNMDLGSCRSVLELSAGLTSIGEHSFENCGLKEIQFTKKHMEAEASPHTMMIYDRAFADNPDLWGINLNDTDPIWGSEVFNGCAEKTYVCYLLGTEEKRAGFTEYAQENHIEAVEIPAFYSESPIVHYPETPLTLTPEVRSFFYGENADDDVFCSFELSDDAPDYGFPEWHLPCGEFCAMQVGKNDITASSELSSSDGRYAARNLSSFMGRTHGWAEGIDGYGVGESISITQCCGYAYNHEWYSMEHVGFLKGDLEPDVYDGYMRYTEICVVNGYAGTWETWEENGRVKRLLMYVEDQPYAYLELEDTIYPQYFSLPVNDIKSADGVDIHFKFIIEEVYPGTKYEDTCLTGLVVDFMGRRGH